MRILQVSSPLQRGGGETHVIELTAALRGMGHEVVVAGRTKGAVNPDVTFPFRNSIDLVTVTRLRSFLKRERFDVVHAHVARDYTPVAAAAWGLPLKLVFTRHLLLPVKSHFLYRRVNGWIAPTQQILETLARLKPRASIVVPNWVDLKKFEFQPHPPHDPLTLGLLGQISPHKGHDDAIAALQLLGLNYRLLIAGKGEDTYVSELRRKASDLPVKFAGFASLPEFFNEVDLLLVPSWEEPFGIVLLEAMASGIPVIATAAGGPPHIIQPGVEGLLVPPRNPQALADAIRSHGNLRERFIQEARRRVEQDFDIQNVVPKIEKFYREL